MSENINRVRELVREAEEKAAIQLRDQGARVYSSLAPPGYPRQPERQGGIPHRVGALLGDAPPPFAETQQEVREPIMDRNLAAQIVEADLAADLATAMTQPVRGQAPSPFRAGGLAPAPYRPLPPVMTAGVPDEPFEPGPISAVGILPANVESPEEQPDTYTLILMSVPDRIAFVRELRRIWPEMGLHAAMGIVRNMPTELILTQQQAYRLANVGASFVNSDEFVEGTVGTADY